MDPEKAKEEFDKATGRLKKATEGLDGLDLAGIDLEAAWKLIKEAELELDIVLAGLAAARFHLKPGG